VPDNILNEGQQSGKTDADYLHDFNELAEEEQDRIKQRALRDMLRRLNGVVKKDGGQPELDACQIEWDDDHHPRFKEMQTDWDWLNRLFELGR
jgi:hypothetical protein